VAGRSLIDRRAGARAGLRCRRVPPDASDDPPDDPEAPLRALCAAGRWDAAATGVVERYGRELLEYLVAIARSEADGADAFSQFTEDLWRGLPRFRWNASARTWCYTLARHALARLRRDPNRRPGRVIALSEAPDVARVAEQVRTRTISYLRTEVKDRVAALREELSPEDQAILILRIDRRLEWRDVVRALADDGDEELTDADVTRRSAALRKRFERIKSDLKRLVERHGVRDT
jgi:RNA polymerase sigma-70 factor (ECF subfamily)